MFDFNLNFLLIFIPIILFSLTIHEYAHAYVAHRLGDDTAKRLGRLTLNPLKHLDPIGTIFMVIFKFGWAKPVPVDPRNFKEPKKDMLYVAIAGPISNILTALVCAFILKFLVLNSSSINIIGAYSEPLIQFLVWMIFIGVVLAVFNMIPIPPLDGSRVMYALLPDSMSNTLKNLEMYGFLIVMGLVFFGGGIFKYILFYPFIFFLQIFNFSNSEINIIFNAMNNR